MSGHGRLALAKVYILCAVQVRLIACCAYMIAVLLGAILGHGIAARPASSRLSIAGLIKSPLQLLQLLPLHLYA